MMAPVRTAVVKLEVAVLSTEVTNEHIEILLLELFKRCPTLTPTALEATDA